MTDDDLREQMMNLSACTLPTTERPTRLAEFDQFFTDAVTATARPNPTRLELHLTGEGDAERVGRDLAARESACCSFFTFTFAPAPAGTLMRIEVPALHVEVLDTLAARADAAVGRAGR
ncbi:MULTISPECIES: hypothetical protein [Nocardia]|uniref:hypothetical protein n=1 Tax=Nocardia TaxID=1817 RepID=UPI001EF62C3F|nr:MULTISPECIES: hypothetical protein [Nocardia]